jgi:hypothetical protein
MKIRWTILLVLATLLSGLPPCCAQEYKPGATDSLKLYRDLEKFSGKNLFTRFLHQLVMKPVVPVSTPKDKDALKNSIPNLDLYNIRIIRNISVIVTDPFGYSVTDTAMKPEGYFQKASNSLHVKSKRSIVRNMLLFHPGEEFEAYLAGESERLLRQTGLFRDVLIYPIEDSTSQDSLDVVVRCIDRWSIYFRLVATTEKISFRITERNLAGYGHTFINRFDFDENGLQGYAFRYDINRIGKSYLTARIYHEFTNEDTRSTALSLIRPFYSPIVKWSYGATIYDLKYTDVLYYNKELVEVPEVNNRGYDLYLSRSFRIKHRGETFEKNAEFTNLILGGRAIVRDQDSKGLDLADSLTVYRPLNYYLGMVALSTLRYEQDNYIIRFGELEDIPLGRFWGIMGGFDPVHGSQYVGLRAGFAAYRNLFYYSLIASAGKFYEEKGKDIAAINLRLTMFSPLLVTGNWRIRQFARAAYTTGADLPENRYLLLSNQPGLERVSDEPLVGYSRLAMSLQTHAYAPLQLIGFRFAPVLFLNGGLISEDQSELFNSKLYSSLGLGLLIRNDHLANSTFQISISFFPNLFGKSDSYRINDIRTNNFQLPLIQQDRPEFVNFN